MPLFSRNSYLGPSSMVACIRYEQITLTTAQRIYFACALILVFLRFSLLHETIATLTGRNTYLL